VAESLADTREPILLDEVSRLKDEYISRLSAAAEMLKRIDERQLLEISGGMSLVFKVPSGVELAISAKNGSSRLASTCYNDGQGAYESSTWDPPIEFDRIKPLKVNRISAYIWRWGLQVNFSTRETGTGVILRYAIFGVPTEYDIEPVAAEN
jgi:hypothetical protein